jgi:hypothetical protein
VLTGVLAAGAMAVPLAAVAWADPPPNPNPPAVPESNGQNPASPSPGGVPAANGLGPANPAAPAGQGPVCVVSANTPTQGTATQGTAGTTWRQVATLQGSVASDLGLPEGQPLKVFCAPAGTQNPQGQPAGAENPGQPNVGLTNPVQNQPGQTGPQNPVPGQQ